MHHLHVNAFTVLSLAIAILGAWTALDLFNRTRSQIGATRLRWLGVSALALGVSIWSMHFIAILGFEGEGPVFYDPGLTLVSFLLATAGTAAAFLTAGTAQASPLRLAPAALLMGGSIVAMHYVGMAAMRMNAVLSYQPALVALSVIVAIAAAYAALIAARQERGLAWRAVAAVILGLAIVSMHHIGMAALILTPIADAGLLQGGASPVVLAVAVTTGAVTLLFLALGASIVDQRANVLAAVDAGGVGFWEATLPMKTTMMSHRAREILSIDPSCRLGPSEVGDRLSPEDLPLHRQALERALAGEGEYDQEWRLLASGRWIHLRGRLIRSRSGRPIKMSGVITDITDRREAFAALADSERLQRLLINELNHRVKNTLATVQSIAHQTARRTPDVATFTALFEARLVALSNTQNLLTAANWEHVDLRAMLAQELAPYAEEQVRLTGPAVDLNAQQTLGMGMVFHELAVNAAKYGALSNASGCVRIDWSVAEGHLLLDWVESGGPAVSPPQRKGFGSVLIDSTINRSLHGSAVMTYDPEGASFSLRLRL